MAIAKHLEVGRGSPVFDRLSGSWVFWAHAAVLYLIGFVMSLALGRLGMLVPLGVLCLGGALVLTLKTYLDTRPDRHQ